MNINEKSSRKASQSKWIGRSGVPGPQPSPSSSHELLLLPLLGVKPVSSAKTPPLSVEAAVCMVPLAKRRLCMADVSSARLVI